MKLIFRVGVQNFEPLHEKLIYIQIISGSQSA